MSKLSLAEICRDHHATLVDVRTGTRRTGDYLALYLPGLLTGGALVAREIGDSSAVSFTNDAVNGMLAAAGLLAAFFFGLSVTVLDKAIDFDLSKPVAGSEVRERATRMQEVAANTAFAAVVAGMTTALLVVSAAVKSVADVAASLAVAGMVTILTTGALVLRRVYNETKTRLRDVRTGASSDR